MVRIMTTTESGQQREQRKECCFLMTCVITLSVEIVAVEELFRYLVKEK